MNRPIYAGLMLLLAAVVTACTADLRGDVLSQRGATADAETRGRQILTRAAESHGVAAFEGHSTVEYVFRDDWDSTLASIMGLEPWDAEDLIRLRMVRGTFDGRVDFVAGPREGEAWGVRDGVHWTVDDGVVERTPDEGEGFVLRALAYLIELPFRIGEGSVVLHDGVVEFEGRRYDRVFVTWGGLEPGDADQYRVYVDRQTGRVGLVDHTVREQGSFFQSRTVYGDHREVAGVLVPFRLTITDVGQGEADPFIHQLVMESAAFDTFAAGAIEPDGALAHR